MSPEYSDMFRHEERARCEATWDLFTSDGATQGTMMGHAGTESRPQEQDHPVFGKQSHLRCFGNEMKGRKM